MVNSRSNDRGRDLQDADLERRAKALFEEGVSGLDGHVRSRLTQARYAAAAQLQQKSPVHRIWLPIAGLATAALVALVVVFGRLPGPGVEQPPAFAALTGEDMVILANSENLELLEDMEFYAWLESEADGQTEQAPGNSSTRI